MRKRGHWVREVWLDIEGEVKRHMCKVYVQATGKSTPKQLRLQVVKMEGREVSWHWPVCTTFEVRSSPASPPPSGPASPF